MHEEEDTEQSQGDSLTPEQFEDALKALGWKGTDFCRRAGIVPNTAWRWRKGLAPIPLWVGEYLRAVLAIQDLHSRFVSVRGLRAKDQA